MTRFFSCSFGNSATRNRARTQRLATGLFSVLLPLSAGAYELTVSWTNPAQNTDGTPIAASGDGALKETRIEYGSCIGSAFGTPIGEEIVAHPNQTVVIGGLAPGVYCVRAYAVNNSGTSSEPSGVAQGTIAAPVPQPPTITTVEKVAYQLDGGKLQRVGEIALGIGCTGEPLYSRGWRTFYAIDPAEITFKNGGQQTGAVYVAACEAQLGARG